MFQKLYKILSSLYLIIKLFNRLIIVILQKNLLFFYKLFNVFFNFKLMKSII